MKIIVAKTAGFCMGVRRAVDMALDTSTRSSGPVYTLGPLIHNHHTLQMLSERGITELPAHTVPSQEPGSTLLIRAHGIPPDTERVFSRKSLNLIDGTCPKVKTVHKVIGKYRQKGYTIVVAGDKGHAEVVGLMGYAGPEAFLVQSPDDIDRLPRRGRFCLVSQTTFDRDLFDRIADRLRDRFGTSDLIIRKTICSATDKRQTETRELSRSTGAMIVVGGRNSANTRRLAEISRSCGTPTQLVESEEDLDIRALERVDTIGVTAGASTPNWMIKRVVDYLQYSLQKHRTSLRSRIKRGIDFINNMNILVSLGAVAVYYGSFYLQNLTAPARSTHIGALVTLLYFLGIYLLNSMVSIEATQHLGISRYRFYRKHRRLLVTLTIVCIVGLLLLSLLLPPAARLLMLLATAGGSLYHIPLVPRQLRGILRYASLRDVPTSRDLFVALAWSVVITLLPQALSGPFVASESALFVFLWVFLLAYLRSLLMDLRDIEGDRIMGRETLVTIIGEAQVRRAVLTMVWTSFLALLVYTGLSIAADFQAFRMGNLEYLFQLPLLLYIHQVILWYPRIPVSRAQLFGLLVDGQFLLAGAGALIAHLTVG